MRLVLEKQDLIKILEKQFDVKLDADAVQVRTDPVFEVEIRGLPLAESALEAPSKPAAPTMKPVTQEDRPSPSGWKVTPPEPAPEPPQRTLGATMSYDPPPLDLEAELSGTSAPLGESLKLVKELA